MKEKKAKKLWGVPVKRTERLVDECKSHIIMRESGLRKRPRKCLSPNIAVSIMWRGRKIFLCYDCWARIADADIEWGNEK